MVGIKDVAHEARAHISAVSRILNNKPHTYSKATAQRVQEAAKRLGYMPRVYAQSMRTGRYNQAVLLGSLEGSTLQDGLRAGAFDRLNHYGMRLGIAYVEDRHFGGEGKLSPYLTSWAADGFLLNYPSEPPQALADFLERYRMPFVSVNVDKPWNAVMPRDVEGGREATRRLIELGHKRIAYITPGRPRHGHYSIDARLRGYRSAMEEAGLEPESFQADCRTFEDTLEQVWNRWGDRDRPTAIISYVSLIVWHLAIESYRRGLKIPDDLSLLTFGDHHVADLGIPISIMGIPFQSVGRKAVDMLMRRIEEPGTELPSESVPLVFSDQGSIGPPGR